MRGFPATVLHPGHLVGRGWAPINPAANFNLQVFSKLAAGTEVLLPNPKVETLHHVHAADVASAFVGAVEHARAAVGESFHVVSPAAVTMRGYAERDGRVVWARTIFAVSAVGAMACVWSSEKDARTTWDHIARSPNCSIEKARRLCWHTAAALWLAGGRGGICRMAGPKWSYSLGSEILTTFGALV